MLHIDSHSPKPIYQQLYDQLKQDILAGHLKKGNRLTSTRALAKGLHILLEFLDGQQEECLVRKAMEQRIRVCPVSPF